MELIILGCRADATDIALKAQGKKASVSEQIRVGEFK